MDSLLFVYFQLIVNLRQLMANKYLLFSTFVIDMICMRDRYSICCTVSGVYGIWGVRFVGCTVCDVRYVRCKVWGMRYVRFTV